MSGPKPAILLFHGGYQFPDIWCSFISTTQNVGFQARCHRQPTRGDTRPPEALLEDDFITVRAAATELASFGYHTIVLAHCYGGRVASEGNKT